MEQLIQATWLPTGIIRKNNNGYLILSTHHILNAFVHSMYQAFCFVLLFGLWCEHLI